MGQKVNGFQFSGQLYRTARLDVSTCPTHNSSLHFFHPHPNCPCSQLPSYSMKPMTTSFHSFNPLSFPSKAEDLLATFPMQLKASPCYLNYKSPASLLSCDAPLLYNSHAPVCSCYAEEQRVEICHVALL